MDDEDLKHEGVSLASNLGRWHWDGQLRLIRLVATVHRGFTVTPMASLTVALSFWAMVVHPQCGQD
jgi:hypothetical protein